jgi:aspartate/methionine/tyrosine aminotransferase
MMREAVQRLAMNTPPRPVAGNARRKRTGGLRQSLRLEAVQAPVIPIVARLIRECPGTISLGQGMVHFPPPPEALAALAPALADPECHRYGPVEGSAALRALIEAKLERENGVDLGGRRVVVTAGGNMAFVNAVLAIADPGDEIVLLAPYYFNHEMAVTMLGCRTMIVPTDANFQPDVERIAAALTPRTRAVVTISPNNPTGAVYAERTLRAVNELCRQHGVYHIHDEAYEYFTYDPAVHVSPASFAGSQEHTIALYSLSKAYGFASWRIGYQVIPEHLFDAVCKIQDTNLICAPAVSQLAAVAALRAGRRYCQSYLEELVGVRAMAIDRLGELGTCVEVVRPDGAFYLFVRVQTERSDVTVVERLVREHRVAVIPGSAFGATEGCFLRISYGALTAATVAEGLGRLVAGLRAIVG